MTHRTLRYCLLSVAVMLSSILVLTSCHKDKDDDDTFSYSTSTSTTLVTGFALQNNSAVLANLDSVYFTVDYDRGLIYNADSLPVGTDITALKVTVNFFNSMKSAVFTITGATQQADTTIGYTSSMNQSIDFTGKTVLRVTSADETQVKDYEVRVLVHKMNPDSLMWPMSWRRDLPGYRSSATAYKAVKQGMNYRAMTYNGAEAVLWTATAPNQPSWNKQVVNLPFTPDVNTLTATESALYMLSADGNLYCSADGLAWNGCGVTWHSILGAYGDRVLGIVGGSDGYYHDEYPQPAGFATARVEDGFPVEHASNMVVADNKWTASPQSIIVGGIDAGGQTLSNVWGYDGARWGKINNIHSSTLPALADATLFPYYTYRELPGVRRYARQLTWYVMGGKLSTGKLNGTIYLSSNQGVTWAKGDSTISQPAHVTKFYGAQAFVQSETLSSSTPRYVPGRVQAIVDTWECPFIYLFGGYDDQGRLLPNLWRGVYNRMTYYPLY